MRKETRELPREMPDFLHFLASGTGGMCVSQGPSRKNILWLSANSPFLSEPPHPFRAATGVEVTAPSFVFCSCQPLVYPPVWRSDDICVNVMSSKWKFFEIFGWLQFTCCMHLSKVLIWGLAVSYFETFLPTMSFPRPVRARLNLRA